MRGPSRRVFLTSVACVSVLFAAVAWVSVTMLGLERSERRMRAQAVVEENVRLTLWRMDSAVTPIVARESARTVADYRESFPTGAYVKLHFQFDAGGGLTSPQGHPDELRALARLARRERFANVLSGGHDPPEVLVARAEHQTVERAVTDQVPVQQQYQQTKSSNEFKQRSWSLDNAYVSTAQGAFDGLFDIDSGARADSYTAPMTPMWIEGELFLARRVSIRGEDIIQGCWLDWTALRGWLLSTVLDLLPNADLVPIAATGEVDQAQGVDHTRRLVSVPARVVAGAVPAISSGRSPVEWILLVVWIAVLMVVGSAVALILGVSSLSERRAAFVAAVTHELRTPLTALQAYSEMLADGKVADPDKRSRYVRTLHREAVRLGHLVENVLSYSRIERGRDGLRRDRVSAREVLERAFDRLQERAHGAHMEVMMNLGDGDALAFIGDASAVEQIVFNLVDNASKYAATAEDRRIEVSACALPRAIEIRVRDHGPGVPADVKQRLFTPFSKSVERAATSAPGVGLGLALSRRLARGMGGELRLDDTGAPGAAFQLRLPPARDVHMGHPART